MNTSAELNVTIPAYLPDLSKEEKRELEKLLNSYGKARRMCYSQRRKKLLNRCSVDVSEIMRDVRKKLGLNSWYVNTAYRSIKHLPLTGVNFGRRRAKEKLDKGLISKEGWHRRRNRILVSEGESLMKGNRCLRIIEKDDGLKLRVTAGIRERIYLDLYIPSKYLKKYGHLLDGSKPYKILICRRKDDDSYDVKITVHPKRELENKERIMALDINSGYIDWAVVDKRNKRLIETGRINRRQVIDSPSNKTENILHQVVNKIGNIAKHHDCEVVAGKLNTGKYRSPSSKASRFIKGMPQFKLRQILSYKLPLRGIPYKERSEAYTSILGRFLCKPLGLDSHKGSAYTFAIKITDYTSFKLLKDSLQDEADGRWSNEKLRRNRLTACLQFLAKHGDERLEVDDHMRLLPEHKVGKGPEGLQSADYTWT